MRWQLRRRLAALGPRMLEVAAARSGGMHPYLTVPSQSGEALTILGPDALVAPEQTVVFDTDPDSARRTARNFLRRYLKTGELPDRHAARRVQRN